MTSEQPKARVPPHGVTLKGPELLHQPKRTGREFPREVRAFLAEVLDWSSRIDRLVCVSTPMSRTVPVPATTIVSPSMTRVTVGSSAVAADGPFSAS
jgi:hypothetical protein